jgi:hypothetical protein
MRRCIAAFAALLVTAPLAAGDKLAVEIGRGLHNNLGSDALFLRYAGDIDEQLIPAGHNFYEWSLATWNGHAENNGAGIALGTLGRWGEFHLDGSLGVAYLEDKTVLSGTHQQFCVRVGAGVAYERLDVGLFLTHYSNAKMFFGWDGPNAGYDFITLQIGYLFK